MIKYERIDISEGIINVKIQELNIKNQTYYFFNNMINIKNFHSNLLKIDKKLHKDFDIY